jgi:hypothetical protein
MENIERIKVEYIIESCCRKCKTIVNYPMDLYLNVELIDFDSLLDNGSVVSDDIFVTTIMNEYPGGFFYGDCPKCMDKDEQPINLMEILSIKSAKEDEKL